MHLHQGSTGEVPEKQACRGCVNQSASIINSLWLCHSWQGTTTADKRLLHTPQSQLLT
jgi:hypothetical protein